MFSSKVPACHQIVVCTEEKLGGMVTLQVIYAIDRFILSAEGVEHLVLDHIAVA